MRQFGTSQDDSIAEGDSIVIDESSGDAIILGNSNGSMMRYCGDGAISVNGSPSDAFIMLVLKENGDSRIISEISKSSSGSGTNKNNDDEDDFFWGGEPDEDVSIYGFEIVAIIVAAIIVFSTILKLGFQAIEGNLGNRNLENSDKILDYVKKFQDEDLMLHVRHSATGGFHGIYSPNSKTNQNRKLPSQVTFSQATTSSSRERQRKVTFQDPNAMANNEYKRHGQTPTSQEENLNVESALNTVEADYNFRNDRTMVSHTQGKTYETQPKPVSMPEPTHQPWPSRDEGQLISMPDTSQYQEPAASIESSPKFDAVMITSNDATNNYGLTHCRQSNLAPPSHAFTHSSDDDEEEWKTEIL